MWIVNLVDQCIEVYRNPAGAVYATRTVHGRGESLHPLSFPDLAIPVNEIL